MSKSVIAQQIYNELVGLNVSKADIINEFQADERLKMTPSGATTYYYNCKRVAEGGLFNIPAGQSTSREAHDNSPDKEDTRPLYTVVTPGDSECGKMLDCQERIDYTLTSTPCPHWGAKCWICGLHRSPITGKIEVTLAEKRQQFEQLIFEGKRTRTRKGANINTYKKKSYK